MAPPPPFCACSKDSWETNLIANSGWTVGVNKEESMETGVTGRDQLVIPHNQTEAILTLFYGVLPWFEEFVQILEPVAFAGLLYLFRGKYDDLGRECLMNEAGHRSRSRSSRLDERRTWRVGRQLV